MIDTIIADSIQAPEPLFATQAERALTAALASPRLAGSDYVRRWLERIHFGGLTEEGAIVLAVAEPFTRDFIDEHFRELISGALETELARPIALAWCVDPSVDCAVRAAGGESARHAPSPRGPSQCNSTHGSFQVSCAPLGEVAPQEQQAAVSGSGSVQVREVEGRGQARFNSVFRFDTFVAGPSNQLAFAGAEAVALNPNSSFNPLFIYGGSGLGKTHLLQAIGNALLARDPGLRILYVSSEEFTNQFIEALRDKRMHEFRRKFRSDCDCLLIDDIQFLGSREQTQEEFFHTFNALHETRRPVAITSDTVPSEIPGLAERLRTRFSSGLLADIQEPDFETRVAILKMKAEAMHFDLQNDVANYIGRAVHRNVRELESALNRVFAHHSLSRQPVTVELAAHLIKNILPAQAPLDIDRIQQEVSKYFKVPLEELRGPKRQRQIVRARQVAMYLSRSRTDSSFPDIGRQFRRDHSTVITSCTKIEDDRSKDPQLQRELDDLNARLSK